MGGRGFVFLDGGIFKDIVVGKLFYRRRWKVKYGVEIIYLKMVKRRKEKIIIVGINFEVKGIFV